MLLRQVVGKIWKGLRQVQYASLCLCDCFERKCVHILNLGNIIAHLCDSHKKTPQKFWDILEFSFLNSDRQQSHPSKTLALLLFAFTHAVSFQSLHNPTIHLWVQTFSSLHGILSKMIEWWEPKHQDLLLLNNNTYTCEFSNSDGFCCGTDWYQM